MADLHERQLVPATFDPKLILKFQLNAPVSEADWVRAGPAVLDSSEREVAVAFSLDAELRRFRSRLEAYAAGVPDDREHARYESFFDAIESFGPIEPSDRITVRLASLVHDEPDETYLMDVEFWFVDDAETLEQWTTEAREAVLASDGRWIDNLVIPSAGVCIARVEGDRSALDGIAALDQVVAIDAVPDPRLTRAELFELQAWEQYDEVTAPDQDAPVVGVIDSGVQSGHPLLEVALAEAVALHPDFGGQAEDANGHGTMVSGRVLYGDVLETARSGQFAPAFWIASVRVLGDDNLFSESVNWITAITNAVTYLAEDWDCRVINLSIGDANSPFVGGKSTPLAAALDQFARQYGVVIVVSAGNVDYDSLSPHRQTFAAYPSYLLEAGREIIDPAQAASCLTVGGIAEVDGASPRPLGGGLGIGSIAIAQGPAPFTRRGPGVGRAIKPELVADAGNWTFDQVTTTSTPDPAVEVMSTINRFPERLFATDSGTSFAAPAVTHLAGRLVTEYPDLDATSVRALLLQGAFLRYPTREALGGDEADLLSLCGMGCVSWERCGESHDNRVVLYAEDSLRPDDFHVYRIPITDEFKQTPGMHRVTVSLAFSPPVRHRRYDYLAYRMEYMLVRGATLEQVFEMAGQDVSDPEAGGLRAYEVPMRPTRTSRARGCNQASTFETSQRPRAQFHDDWYVVVRSLNRWMPRDSPADPYSLAVALEVERAEELYVELQAALEIEVELRI